MDKDKFYFFYGGPFSQWASFDIEVAGVVYCTCEQYMMACKAKLFGDKWTYREILKEKDPKKQKALGRQIKNFDKKKWEKIARDVIYKANYAKFTQYSYLYNMLMQTGDRIIVEASPYDCIWGIGLRASDKRACDPVQWRGKNWLGKAIMKVRAQLQKIKINKTNEQ